MSLLLRTISASSKKRLLRGSVPSVVFPHFRQRPVNSIRNSIRMTATKSGSSSFHDKLTSTSEKETEDAKKKLIRETWKHVWPDDKKEWNLRTGVKPRVLAALSCMVGGKLIMIQVPFLFKNIVDSLVVQSPGSEIVPELATVATTAVPVSLLLGYGLARSSAMGLQELRNAVFATVAQPAVRRVAVRKAM